MPDTRSNRGAHPQDAECFAPEALPRCAASGGERAARRLKQVELAELRDRELFVDGYNVLLTLEVALGGGVVLAGRDGTFRDMASLSGHYRKVKQTRPALEAAGGFLDAAGCRSVEWYLDRPVSNSARLRAVMEEIAESHGWPWRVELSPSPDLFLMECEGLVATADSAVLDCCQRWYNLARSVVEGSIAGAWIVDLSRSEPPIGQESV